MPDYKKQMQAALYGDSLNEKERNDFIAMMNLLQDKTPEQYAEELGRKIEKKTALYDGKVSEFDESYKVMVENFQNDFDENMEGKANEVFNFGTENQAVINQSKMSAQYLVKIESTWDDENITGKKKNAKGIQEVYEDIQKDIEKELNERMEEVGESAADTEIYFNQTETYKNCDQRQQMLLTSYINSIDTMSKQKSNLNKEEAEKIDKGLSELRKEVLDYKKQRDEEVEKTPLKQEINSLKEEIKNLKAERSSVLEFGREVYNKPQTLSVNSLSDSAQKKGLDLLTQARAEYRNNLNFVQRILANVLSSSFYAPAKYVDKINAYKETLSDMGFTDEQIESADPEKSADYTYNKDDKKYVKAEKSVNGSAIKEEPQKEEKLGDDSPEFEIKDEPFLEGRQENKVKVNFAEKEQNDFSFRPAGGDITNNSKHINQPSLGKTDNLLNK